MSPAGGWRRYFRLGHTRQRVEEEVEDELRFHMEGLVDRYRTEGLSEEAAWERARRTFGDPDTTLADLTTSAWRNRRLSLRREWMDGLRQDLRLSLRQMVRRPGFAAAVILTLGLGIGANTAIFSVLRSVVLAPLPYAEPERLMTVWTPWEGYRFNPLSAPDWADLKEGSSSFQAWGVYEWHSLNLSGDGNPEQVSGIRGSAEIFQALEVEGRHRGG